MSALASSTHLLVGNPTAQSGKNAQRLHQARQLFRQAGIACDFLPTEPEGKTIGLVQDAIEAHPYEVVIYQGGDGTFREVASGILRCQRPEEVALGMLPSGTANDQGRSFGLDAGEAALPGNVEVITRGYETRLDAGQIRTYGEEESLPTREEFFFDSAGWGISARILRARNADRRIVEHLGPLSAIYRDHLLYAGAALRVFLESYATTDQFTAKIEADGDLRVLEGLTDLIVKGTRVYAGAWVFDRNSRHDDGKFEVCPFRGKLDWTSTAIVNHQKASVTGEILDAIGIERSHPFSASKISLSFIEQRDALPLAAQVDGEEFPATSKVQIDVLPRALRLIVPEVERGLGPLRS